MCMAIKVILFYCLTELTQKKPSKKGGVAFYKLRCEAVFTATQYYS